MARKERDARLCVCVCACPARSAWHKPFDKKDRHFVCELVNPLLSRPEELSLLVLLLSR
jgi:hypothetical protein